LGVECRRWFPGRRDKRPPVELGKQPPVERLWVGSREAQLLRVRHREVGEQISLGRAAQAAGAVDHKFLFKLRPSPVRIVAVIKGFASAERFFGADGADIDRRRWCESREIPLESGVILRRRPAREHFHEPSRVLLNEVSDRVFARQNKCPADRAMPVIQQRANIQLKVRVKQMAQRLRERVVATPAAWALVNGDRLTEFRDVDRKRGKI
jgi:hypothetical protein